MNDLGELLYDLVLQLFDIQESTDNAEIVRVIIMGINVLLWVIVGFITNRVSKAVIYKVLRVDKKGPRALTIANLVRSVVRYVVWFIVILVILSSLGVDLTPFIASAGVVGLAIGFGAQEIVRDFMSGFFIIFDGEFEVGEVIEVEGFKGTVLSLGLRTTVIENWKGERKIINNGKLGSVINFSRNNSTAIIDFGVAYDSDLLKIQDLMPAFLEELRNKYEMLTDTPVFLGVTELANSSINMRIIGKTQSMKHFQVERDIRRDLVLYFDEHDIEIPFPQVVLHNAKV